MCIGMWNRWQTSRVEGSQGRANRFRQRRRCCGVKRSTFCVTETRNGGDKLVVTGVGRVCDLGEQHCVKLQALRVYDTQKKCAVPPCSPEFRAVPMIPSGATRRR